MTRLVNVLSLAVVGLALAALAFTFRDVPWSPVRVAGAALAIPAFVLWALARINLGQSFAVKARAHTLVRRGLYRRFRHPVYLFGSLGIAGLILFSGRLLFLLVFVIIIPMQIARTRREDQVLERTFGDEYREYRRTTWL